MFDIEKVLKGLEAHATASGCMKNCPYWRIEKLDCSQELAADAFALLKAQQPRVLTVEEVQTVPKNSVIWYEINDAVFGRKFDLWPFIRSDDDWFSPEFPTGRQMFDESDKLDYGKKFRCWSARPTNKERKAVKWDE